MASPGAPRDRRARRIVHNSTFIAPSTGERIKRVFSLRDASRRYLSSDEDETQPLLPNNTPSQKPTWRSSFTQKARQHARDAERFWRSTTGQGIFKCSLAYLLGSMATFVPPIASLIGRQDSKHMVATVTVYFHPARTIGSMHEATVLALIAFCYAAFVSFTSMGLSMFLGQNDLLTLAHVIDLVIFCGVGLGFIAWTKQYFGHPLVNVACSLASLGTITSLVKEGSVQTGHFSEDKVTQIMIMVLMGVLATTLVNMAVLPIRARRRLHKDLVKSTDLLGEILINTTRAFLVGEEDILRDGKQAIKEHESTLKSMNQNLIEAKREHYVLGTERRYLVEAKLVKCLVRLSQDLGGLRSAASTQFSILSKALSIPVDSRPMHSAHTTGTSTPIERPKPQRRDSISRSSILDVITEDPSEMEDVAENGAPSSWQSHDGASTPTKLTNRVSFQQPTYSQTETTSNEALGHADMFTKFINLLGPPAKSLAYTLKQILNELQFDRDGTIHVNDQFADSLRSAIELYKESREMALKSLYQSRALNGQRSEEVLADLEEVAASCGHFSFSLLDFADDALKYLDLLEDLKAEIQQSPKIRSWQWLKWWQRDEGKGDELQPLGPMHETPDGGDPARNIPTSMHRADNFADPSRSVQDRPWTYTLYKAMRVFRRDDVRFAVKVGVGAALYALPAYLHPTRPFFTHWRGEWGLVSYMVVCSMTIGASNTTGINRFIGTLIGAALAITAWLIANNEGRASPYILAFIGWLVSLGCFYIILAKNNGPMGRFILLTYNLGALYAYSLSVQDDDNDDDEGGIDPAIWEIVLHRVVSVIVGCLWGIIITRFIWPISARTKLKDGLCILWLRMSLIWKRDPLAVFLLGEPKSSYMDIREEAELQNFLTYLDSLRKAAASEFELRGPFPDKLLAGIIERTKRMLESFHAMNVVIQKNLRATPGEAAVLRYTREQRFALSARISHLFSVLASSLKLEYPLSDVLPNIEDRRDRLLARVFEFRRSQTAELDIGEADYEMIYAYVLVTGQLADDLSAVIHDLETLFGTLNEDMLKLQ